MLKIRFSIWIDQYDNFKEALDTSEYIDLCIAVSDRLAGSYKGWYDFNVAGSIDKVMLFFHELGKDGFNIHVFKNNPVA